MSTAARNLYLELQDAADNNEELDTSSGCDMSFELSSSENVGPMSPPPAIVLQQCAPRKLLFTEGDEVCLFVFSCFCHVVVIVERNGCSRSELDTCCVWERTTMVWFMYTVEFPVKKENAVD